MSEISVDVGQLSVRAPAGDPAASPRVGPLAEAALGRLVERGGLPEGLPVEIGAIVGPDVLVPPGADERQIAELIAQAVYRALGRQR